MYLELPLWAHKLLDRLVPPLIYTFILPPTVLYHSVLYFLRPPSYPGWTYRHYIALNIRRVKFQYWNWGRLPPPDPEREVIPSTAGKYLGRCEVEKVVVPRLKDGVPRLTVLSTAREMVKDRDVVGFMIRSSRSDDTASLDAQQTATCSGHY
jgi:hypothetical protein